MIEFASMPEHGTGSAKLSLDQYGANAILRIARLMRIVGIIQIALAAVALLVMMAVDDLTPMIMIMVVAAAGWLLQGERTQSAGEQLRNLAAADDEDNDDGFIDYLTLAFVRLRTVFIIDIIIAVLLGAQGILGHE